MRACQQCAGSMEGKRSNALYCSRDCKSKASESRRVRDNRDRYEKESERRKQYARDSYWSDPDKSRDYSKQWRKSNPEKRATQNANRRAAKYANPGYVPVTPKEWRRILNRFGNACAYCGRKGELQMDHVIPLCRGGRHAPANMVPACPSCNASKNGSFLAEWRYKRKGGDAQ